MGARDVFPIPLYIISAHTIRSFDKVPSIVGGFVVKNDPPGLQKQPRGNVPLAWPSPIHPFRSHSGDQILSPVAR